MANYRVAITNERNQPLAGVTIEAVSLNSFPTISATANTGNNGTAQFSGLSGPHWFAPRVRRTSGNVGERTYTGQVKIQIVALGESICFDYVVDPDGMGTHTTLAGAVAAAITAGTDKSIWICDSLTESNIDVGGMGSAQNIYFMSSDRNIVSITANSGEDIFVQDSTGGNSSGGLHFHSVGFIPDNANSKSIYQVNTGSEVTIIEFEQCKISGGYFLRQNGLESLGGINLKIRNCDGSAKGFYQVTGASGTLAPDQINAYNNELSLTEWWSDGSSTAVPDFVRITGGRYTIDTALDIPGTTNEYHWSSLVINYTATGAAFTSGGSSSNIEDITLQDIVFRVSNAGGLFCNFGSNSSSVNNGLFIKNIYGFPIAGLSITGSTTFITVDTDWTSVHVGNVLAKGWTTLYSGPAFGDLHTIFSGTHTDTLASSIARGNIMIANSTPAYAAVTIGADGSLLSSDGTDASWQTDIHLLGYLGIGSAAAPTNTTAGDLTVIRAFINGQATIDGDMFVLNGRGVVIGHTAQVDFGAIPEFQILGTGAPDSSMGFARFSANAGGATLRFLKSRSGTIGGQTIVQDGDELGRIRFQAADSDDFNTNAAEISAEVDGTPGFNDMPGRILFSTTSDGASSVTERMRLTSTGQLRVLNAGIYGSLSAPTNTTDGDLTVTRLLVTDTALDSEARLFQILDAYTPSAGAFNTLYTLVNVTPGVGDGADDIRAIKFEVNIRPTANHLGKATGLLGEADHDSGSFDVAALTGVRATASQGVGSTTVATARGLRPAYRAIAGTITLAIGVDITRGVSGDSGTIDTGIGLRIGASAGVTPGTADIALQSLGGVHEFVGNVRIGSTTAPTVALDVTGAALISSTLGVTGQVNLEGILEIDGETSVPGTAAAGDVRLQGFTTGGRTLPMWQDESDYQFMAAEKVLAIYPEPANFTNGATTTGLPTTTAAFIHRVEIKYPIHATELIYFVSSAADNVDCTMRIALYSHDGADRLIDEIDDVGTGTGARTVDITDVWLWPGHYYIFICVSDATGNGSTVSLMQSLNFAIAGGSGKADIGGTLTVTAGAAPSTIDPTAITTPSDDKALAVRINGD